MSDRPIIRLTTKLSESFNKNHAVKAVAEASGVTESEAARALPEITHKCCGVVYLDALAKALEALGFGVTWLC